MIYIITKDGKKWEMNQSQLFSFIDKQTSDGYDYINNMETAEQWLKENGYNITNRTKIILEYLKQYGFEQVENVDIWKKRKGTSCFYMYVILEESYITIYTQTEQGPDCKKTSFDTYEYNRLSKKEFSIFGRMFINMLSFFEK